MDHLPHPPHAPEPRLPELQPAGRSRLVTVRVVRQGLRAARAGHRDAGAGAGCLDPTGRIAAPQGGRPTRATRPARPGSTRTAAPDALPERSTPPDGEGLRRAMRQQRRPPRPSPPHKARVGLVSQRLHDRGSCAGLFVVGWLGTLIGGVVLFVSLQTSPGVAKLALFIGGLALLSLGLIAAAGSQGIERRARGVGPYARPVTVLVFVACIPTSAVLLVLLGVPLELAGIDVDARSSRSSACLSRWRSTSC